MNAAHPDQTQVNAFAHQLKMNGALLETQVNARTLAAPLSPLCIQAGIPIIETNKARESPRRLTTQRSHIMWEAVQWFSAWSDT